MSKRLTIDEFRTEVLSLLARSTPFDDPDEPDDVPEGGIPTAALVMVEWQSTDGDRWLSRVGMLASGQSAPRWTIEMLAREALTWDEKDTS